MKKAGREGSLPFRNGTCGLIFALGESLNKTVTTRGEGGGGFWGPGGPEAGRTRRCSKVSHEIKRICDGIAGVVWPDTSAKTKCGSSENFLKGREGERAELAGYSPCDQKKNLFYSVTASMTTRGLGSKGSAYAMRKPFTKKVT